MLFPSLHLHQCADLGQFLCLNESNATSVVVIRSRTAASQMSLK